jgi:beta-galactosidase
MTWEDASSRPKAAHLTATVERPPHFAASAATVSGTPTFYRGHFTLPSTGGIFLDVRSLAKGALWINGHPIGRFWNIGPQLTLFVPGPGLREGDNEIVVFDLAPSAGTPALAALATPILDGPVIDTSVTRKQE